jgi:hypothetical protein
VVVGESVSQGDSYHTVLAGKGMAVAMAVLACFGHLSVRVSIRATHQMPPTHPRTQADAMTLSSILQLQDVVALSGRSDRQTPVHVVGTMRTREAINVANFLIGAAATSFPRDRTSQVPGRASGAWGLGFRVKVEGLGFWFAGLGLRVAHCALCRA